MMSSSATARNRFPFTASQWQELEHQALVYKYMISGMPIPPDLLFTIKRSLDSSLSSSSPKLFLHQPQHSIGWNYLQMGFGRKIDPEPGRCRRTDGKKWRCSKEAYPDSKYCERHMHRGRNRSRKPVELVNLTTPAMSPAASSSPAAAITTSTTYSHSTPPPTAIPITISPSNYHHPSTNSSYNSNNNTSITSGHPFLYPSSRSSSSRPPGAIGNLSSHDHFLLESDPYSSHSDKDYRNSYGSGMKEDVDERSFFSETCGTVKSMCASSMGDSWHLEPLTMGSSLAHSKQRSCSDIQNGYSYLQLQSLSNYEMPLKNDTEDEPQKVMHHFFDEWPHKNKDSTTQLSISIPNSSHDFFMTHNDK